MRRHLTAALLAPSLACARAGAVTKTDAAGGALLERLDIDLHAPRGDHRSVVFGNPVC